MSDYSNEVRRAETGYPYRKKIDGIRRHNVRRVAVVAQGQDTFNVDPLDAVLIVNINAGAGVVNLPPLTRVKNGQSFVVQACDPDLNGNGLTINADGLDPVNEGAGPVVIINDNESRKIQRVHSIAIDSWYTVCCAPNPPL